MARIDRRHAAGEQGEEGRLRPLQGEGDRVIAFGRDIVEVAVPRLARVEPQLVRRFPVQHVPGALDVGRGERLSVMPFDALAQFEAELCVVLVPGPAQGQFGLDEFRPVLFFMLVEQHKVVEDGHHRSDRRDRRLLEDRHARRAVAVKEFEHPAALLRECCGRHRNRQAARRRERRYSPPIHLCPPDRHFTPYHPRPPIVAARLAPGLAIEQWVGRAAALRRYPFSGCQRPSIAPVGSTMIENEPAFGTSVTSRRIVAPSDAAAAVAAAMLSTLT